MTVGNFTAPQQPKQEQSDSEKLRVKEIKRTIAVDRNSLFANVESNKQGVDAATRNLKAQQKPEARARKLAAKQKGSGSVAARTAGALERSPISSNGS